VASTEICAVLSGVSLVHQRTFYPDGMEDKVMFANEFRLKAMAVEQSAGIPMRKLQISL
jgi:hypothetical protein